MSSWEGRGSFDFLIFRNIDGDSISLPSKESFINERFTKERLPFFLFSFISLFTRVIVSLTPYSSQMSLSFCCRIKRLNDKSCQRQQQRRRHRCERRSKTEHLRQRSHSSKALYFRIVSPYPSKGLNDSPT
jgi:hypothetical protein